jgi:acyl-CoA synthetase (AMP-forming)/AMP-acid ligase II
MTADTLARVFWSRVEESADRPAQQLKRDGAWQTLAWREVGEIVREIALGLIALGRERGDSVGLLAASRVEWVQADFAIFSAGSVTIPIYPSYPPELIAYIVNDSGAKTLIVEDPIQLAKALEARGKMQNLEQIVVMSGWEGHDPSGGTGSGGSVGRTPSPSRPRWPTASPPLMPKTSRRSSTPPARPGRPRASCRPTPTISPRSGRRLR